MLADPDAPQRATSLADAFGYARQYAEELRAILAAGQIDHERTHRLVQAMHNTVLAALDDIHELDDVQQEIDATDAIQALSDEELFKALVTPHKPPTAD
ncbi:hypothetical protein ABZ622_13915 [Streptomyces sp. NPDC007164]|uniref:hypothetical protein n=1 Tax=Streptomyces sp. NPDC007164 TaxID=3156918 RepID=UPI0033CB7082